MSRVPTSASETGTTGSNGALDAHAALMEKTGLTPAGMGMGTGMSPLVGGQVGASGTLNGLDVVGVRNQEEEGTRKMEEIVAIVGTKWGRVCQEGLERAAKRVGLECLWEEGRGGKRTLSIAGNGVLVDVGFNMEEVQNVTLEYANSGLEVGKKAAEGADVLKKNLKGSGDGGYVLLDAFVGNLERLARMDKLSEGGVSCFDAVEGLRAALQTVFDLEARKTREEKGPDASKEEVDREVLYRGSGRPKMHTGGRVGLALQYWVERRLLLPAKQEPEAMNIDSDTTTSDDEPIIYSAILESEATVSSMYPPIRVSDSWLGSPVEKPTPAESDPFLEQTCPINWQEPPQTNLLEENTTTTDIQDPHQTPKTPNVRFVARFEPPLVVPLQIAADIYQTVGAPLTQDSIHPTTYESLLFADTPGPPQGGHRTVTKKLNSYDTFGAPTEHTHTYTLFTLQPDYGRVIDSIPFSHPRQLIAILPLLRQWALIGSLIRRSFVPDPPFTSDSTSKNVNRTDEGLEAEFYEQEMTVEEELAALLGDEPSAPTTVNKGDNALPVDITLSSTSTPPRIGAIWPQAQGLRSVDFGIGLNGVIEVSDNKGEEAEGRAERTQRALSISEDIGVLVEWLGERE